jgi:hypothetical protein
VWVPSARVDHFVPASSMTLAYVARRYRLHGVGLMLDRRSLLAAADAFASLVFDAAPRYALARLLRRPMRRRLRQFRRMHTHAGRLAAFLSPRS